MMMRRRRSTTDGVRCRMSKLEQAAQRAERGAFGSRVSYITDNDPWRTGQNGRYHYTNLSSGLAIIHTHYMHGDPCWLEIQDQREAAPRTDMTASKAGFGWRARSKSKG